MYCPKCKEEYTGKFCPECGTQLITVPKQNDISLNLSDKAAVLGGLNVTRNDSHNTTNYDQRVMYNNNVTNNITKSGEELHHERKQKFLECCRNLFRNGLLDEEEKLQLETERIRLGVEEQEAAVLIEQARKISGCRMTSLGVRDAMTLKNIDRYIEINNTTILQGQIPRLEALAQNYNIEEILYKNYMLQAALSPGKLISYYQRNVADEYWKTFWVAVAYMKCGDNNRVEEAIVKLDLYPEYPEDNSLLLSALSTYNDYGAEEAANYINAVLPEQCSPLLIPFVQALYLKITPERADEIGSDKRKCQFYIDNLITLKSTEEKYKPKVSASEAHTTGDNYFYGRNGKIQSYTEAVKWYRIAAEQGDAGGQNDLAYCYKQGYGVIQSYTEAVKWYHKAAEQGNAPAQYGLGCCYEKGKGVSQSYTDAVNWFRKAAEQDYAAAQNNLGFCYYNGNGVIQSYTEAVKWYRKAAEQGVAGGQYNLGFCYENGKGVTKNKIEAVRWYRKAAEQGHARAQNNLGDCYYKGNGVALSYKEAVEWFRKAAEQGYVGGQYNLGFCYKNGKGVAKNIIEAIKWWRKAAEQGYKTAIDKLQELGY